MTGRRALILQAKAMLEEGRDGLTGKIIELAQSRGVLVAHFPKSQVGKKGQHMTSVAGDGAGYPDLTLVGTYGPEWWELKTQVGRLSPKQVGWRDRLVAAGQVHRVVRPEDLLAGRVDKWLTNLGRTNRAWELMQGRLDEALDLLAEERRQHERDLEVDGV